MHCALLETWPARSWQACVCCSFARPLSCLHLMSLTRSIRSNGAVTLFWVFSRTSGKQLDSMQFCTTSFKYAKLREKGSHVMKHSWWRHGLYPAAFTLFAELHVCSMSDMNGEALKWRDQRQSAARHTSQNRDKSDVMNVLSHCL